MREFIYFFKHKGVNAIKIGKTSGESVKSRFDCFKTYSPMGAEIIGFFSCENAVNVESKIHNELSANRMCGEWFNISDEQARAIVHEYDKSIHKVKQLFEEWVANPENDIENLIAIFKGASEVIPADSVETQLIKKHFRPDDKGVGLTATQVKKKLEIAYGKPLRLRKIGLELKRLGFKCKIERINMRPAQIYKISENGN